MKTLSEKYRKYPRVQYNISGEAPKKGNKVTCSLCKNDFIERVEKGSEYICHLCLMGMADAYRPEDVITQEELIKAIRDRKLQKLRVKYNISQSALGRIIGISKRQVQRYENSQYISLDSVIKKVQENGFMSPPATSTIKTPKKAT